MTVALGIAPGRRLHANDTAWLDRFQAAGVPAIRVAAPWNSVEPKLGGAYDWSWPDTLLTNCEARGIAVLLEASTRDSDLYASGLPAQYVKFHAALAQRYQGRILATAGPNEPNHVKVAPVPSAKNYTDLILKPSYEAIKKVAPRLTVLTGGMGGGQNDADDGDSADFVEEIYKLGGRGYFDALGYHPYSRGSATWAAALLDPKQGANRLIRSRQSMKTHGDRDLKVWITENGYPTGGKDNAVSPAKQAELLREWVTWSRTKWWMGPLFWFDHADDPTADVTNQGDFMGLWTADAKPKPSLAVFTSLARAA